MKEYDEQYTDNEMYKFNTLEDFDEYIRKKNLEFEKIVNDFLISDINEHSEVECVGISNDGKYLFTNKQYEKIVNESFKEDIFGNNIEEINELFQKQKYKIQRLQKMIKNING